MFWVDGWMDTGSFSCKYEKQEYLNTTLPLSSYKNAILLLYYSMWRSVSKTEWDQIIFP